MKIDIHVHTKKTKKGDAPSRDIDAKKFYEIISSTDVKIVAITNHNVFDLDQYNEFLGLTGNDFQIWPGVELDVVEEDRRGHLLVIVSPKNAEDLARIMEDLGKGVTPDAFTISIDNVLDSFDDLNPLYVAHYKQKKPDLIDADIEKIIEKTRFKSRVLKEATNAISAGIFINHGHSSIYGSDVQVWDNYLSFHAARLPDLRLPVESFEQFCLLLEKDKAAITTLLSKKHPETISISPFGEGEIIDITVYDDINIFFGSKGTGKSDILKAIAKFYSNRGINTKVFESGSAKLSDIFDLVGKKMQVDLLELGVDYCMQEIDFIKKSREVDITSIYKYEQFFSGEFTNKKARAIAIQHFQAENLQASGRGLDEVHGVQQVFSDFIRFLKSEKYVEGIIGQKNFADLTAILGDAVLKIKDSKSERFLNHKSLLLFNTLIEKIKQEITRKTGMPAKPTGTGFREYALNRMKIEVSLRKIIKSIDTEIRPHQVYVGSLGDKGELFCKTEMFIQDGSVHDKECNPLFQYKSTKKTTQKDFSKIIKSIECDIYTEKLFEKVLELNSIEGIEGIPSIIELVVFKKYFTIDDVRYEPSTGEQSMILLHRELNEDKDIYILDEPEKSLGNEYINNVIVPLIKEKAKTGKKIFIATHDANIAVRTLPYNSVYRYHGKSGYKTYLGNPFSNYLINIAAIDDKMDWKEISMRTLEGGRAAFGERGNIYGNF